MDSSAPKGFLPPQISAIDPRGPISAACTLAFFALVVARSVPSSPGSFLPGFLNPTGLLTWNSFFMFYLATIPGKKILSASLDVLQGAILKYARIDEGESKVKKLEVLEMIDVSYLTLNTMIEFVGLNHIVAFLLSSDTEKRIESFGVYNTFLAFVFCLTVNDLIYYAFHYFAHSRHLYPYCHKQHHRNSIPFRGYLDAANQHPFEQTSGFSIIILSFNLTAKVTGLHASAAWCILLCWGTLEMANHCPYDSEFHLPLPYPLLSKDHQMHHRIPGCNFCTLTSVADRIFGTFRSYQPLDGVAKDDKPKFTGKMMATGPVMLMPNSRPEAFPSWFSVAVLVPMFCAAAIIVEAIESGSIPELFECMHFLRPVIVMINFAGVCAATEGTTPKQMDRPVPQAGYPLVEVVPEGHIKSFNGDREVWKTKMDPVRMTDYKLD